ncbi:hypothetical protein [Chondromyces apiculatus]|uniref:Uncharacterized protein n=1 Tax=Chondromyces apiculatus DSM 436 TaxID=1192034 RepID=A0A017T986_9BACT|nr:hypothetical protein [Chondromyces apiculatus]EYF05156.1 Hypothetical protein CAP_3521 [Chondromyces apiculatus DSM 436]
MIPLDIRVPFVRAVCAILEGRGGHDEAIDILVAAERKHGVRIIRDDGCGSLATVMAPHDPSRPPTMRAFLELMATFPQGGDNGALDAFHARAGRMYRAAVDDEAPEERLFPFLTEVAFLVGGTDFANDHWIAYPGGVVASWTQRAWGHTLAEWAHATGWERAHRRTWDSGDMTYVTFSFSLHGVIERYDAWVAAVLEVIRRKCVRQMDEAASGGVG